MVLLGARQILNSLSSRPLDIKTGSRGARLRLKGCFQIPPHTWCTKFVSSFLWRPLVPDIDLSSTSLWHHIRDNGQRQHFRGRDEVHKRFSNTCFLTSPCFFMSSPLPERTYRHRHVCHWDSAQWFLQSCIPTDSVSHYYLAVCLTSTGRSQLSWQWSSSIPWGRNQTSYFLPSPTELKTVLDT